MKKRRWQTDEFRRQVADETLADQDSVSVVARRHDLNPNLVFRWRRKYMQGMRSGSEATTALVPYRQAPEAPMTETTATAEETIEIALSGGHRLRARAEADPGALRLVLQALR